MGTFKFQPCTLACEHLIFGGEFVKLGTWWRWAPLGSLKNEHSVKFWQDSWVPDVAPLADHALHPIQSHEWHLTVHNYASNGAWNWDVLHQILPYDICCKIAGIKAPCAGIEDFPIWRHSSDGFFSVKSAYLHLYQDL